MPRLIILLISYISFSIVVNAQEAVDVQEAANVQETAAVEVGKHVVQSVSASNMILSLLLILAVIIVSAYILKRFQGAQYHFNGMKILSTLHVGSKEKIMVVDVNGKQLLLGVTSQKITLLDTLDNPLPQVKQQPKALPKTLARFLNINAVNSDSKP